MPMTRARRAGLLLLGALIALAYGIYNIQMLANGPGSPGGVIRSAIAVAAACGLVGASARELARTRTRPRSGR